MQFAKWTALSFLALAGLATARAIPHFGSIANELSRQEQASAKAEGLEVVPTRRLCGASFKHVGGLVLEKTDLDAKMFVEGFIAQGKLTLKLGDVKEREISIAKILLPIETINYRCIHIRQTNLEMPTIVCLESKSMRNFWINSITDAVLCSETSIRGKLPENKYTAPDAKRDEMSEGDKGTETEGSGSSAELAEAVGASAESENGTAEGTRTDSETSQSDEGTVEAIERAFVDAPAYQSNESKINLLKEEYEDDVENKNNGKGLKLRIAKGKYGYPKIKINGTDMEEVQRSQSQI